ncbi:MAG: glycosyltransferase [Lachnospiraceae bacterium]|nr:glycosyltransferase [Lachnospiraceae bacterium]
MKKILFIIWSHSLGGGAEALLTTIVNRLNPQKYQLGIIEFYHSTVKKEPVNSNIRIYDPITFEGDREYQKKLYYVHREPERMIGKYIPEGYDLYISFNYQIPSFLLPEGERNIAWIHGTVYDLAESGMEEYRYLQSKAFGKVANIVAISDITAKSIRTLFPEHADKLIKMYNALDIRQVRKKADNKTDVCLGQQSIICVGRLDDNKDPMRMLDIFYKVSQKQYSAHLYFLGKGELESQILEKADEYGLRQRVHVLGYVENPFPIIKQADVCCMTSKSEGFGMVLLECVALHVPFVSTDVGGAAMIANEERCGRIFKTDEQAADCIFELLKTPKDVIQKECEDSIRRFDLDVYISRIEDLVDDVLNSEMDWDRKRVWDKVQDMGELEDRNYYYRFPEKLLPKDSRIILYGAGDIGRNYYNYIKESGACQVTAWVDAAADNHRDTGKNVRNIETIFQVEYDFLLIAVMAEKTAQSIRRDLCKRGVPDSKILWSKPIF